VTDDEPEIPAEGPLSEEAVRDTLLTPSEAVAGMHIRVPYRGNKTLRRVLDRVNDDRQLKGWWHVSNVNAVVRLEINDHSWVHIQIVANIGLKLLRQLVKHGVEPSAAGGTVSVTAHDEARNVRIEVEDDGPGMDPSVLEARLGSGPGDSARSGFGLRSVDERLRAVYGDSHGLVIETAPGAGCKIVLWIPKYRPQVHA